VAPVDDEPETEIDLADLIGDVPKNRKICCPFHDEETPSMHIYQDHYHCYGCDAHGDHISWLTQVEGLSFYEAVDEINNWDGPVVERSAERDAKDDAERTEYALRWWKAAKPMTGRPAVDGSIPMTSRLAARYLADTRGIDLNALPANINMSCASMTTACLAPASPTPPGRADARSNYRRANRHPAHRDTGCPRSTAGCRALRRGAAVASLKATGDR
jgi:hypothetical protein